MAVSKSKKTVTVVEEVDTLGVAQEEVIESTSIVEDDFVETKKLNPSLSTQKNWTDFYSENFEGINSFLNTVDYMDTRNNERHRILYFLSQSPEALIDNHFNKGAVQKLVEDIKNKFNY